MAEQKPKRTKNNPSKASKASALLPLVTILVCGVLICIVSLTNASAQGGSGAPATNGSSSTATPEQLSSLVSRGSFAAVSHSLDKDGKQNISLACEAIDAVVVEPGETFSFNDLVGDTSADERYKFPSTANSGDVDSAADGGINQVSSAIYLAALYANLEIVERHPNAVVLDYVPAGLDAAVSYSDAQDLKIKNNTDQIINLSIKAVDQTVIAEILGEPLSEGITIDTSTDMVSYSWKHNDSSGQDELYRTITSYRLHYLNGEIESIEYLATDTYMDLFSQSQGNGNANGAPGVLGYLPIGMIK